MPINPPFYLTSEPNLASGQIPLSTEYSYTVIKIDISCCKTLPIRHGIILFRLKYGHSDAITFVSWHINSRVYGSLQCPIKLEVTLN